MIPPLQYGTGEFGKVIEKYKMNKHSELKISDTTFAWKRREGKIAVEAAPDCI